MNRKLLRSLRHKKHRREHGLFLVEGVRLVGELLSSPLVVRLLLVEQERRDAPAIAGLLARAGDVPVEELPRRRIDELCATVHPQGVVAVAPLPRTPLEKLLELDRLLVLDRVADPGNLGTLLRSAWALGADGALLTPGSVEVTGDKALRSSMGASFHLPWAEAPPLDPLCEALRAAGFALLAAAPTGGRSPREITLPPRWALLLGGEAHGLPPDIRAQRLTIPMRPGVESLNVAAAGAILLHELSRQS